MTEKITDKDLEKVITAMSKIDVDGMFSKENTLKHKVRTEERNRIKAIIDEVKKKCDINEHTHLCVRVIPKTDDELISQLRCAQANIIKEIERQIDDGKQYREHTEIYIKAVEKWGDDSQILMTIEELSELTKVLCKVNRKINGCTIEMIATEVADVEIMLEQIKIIFSNTCDKDFLKLIETYKYEKLKRLKKMVES